MSRWTMALEERRATLAVLAGSSLVLALLFLFGFLPLRAQREIQAQRLQDLETRLQPYRARERDTTLAEQALLEQTAYRALRAEMDQLLRMKDTFKGGSPVARIMPSAEEGRIDFKVALFHARSLLNERAGQRGIRIPPTLGMEETIVADEPAENRLWQLAAVMRLIEYALDAGVSEVEHIEPLPSRDLALSHPEYSVLRQFPVKIALRCSYPQALAYLAHLQRPDGFFTVRRFRIEGRDPAQRDLLRVSILCSAGQPRAAITTPAAPEEEHLFRRDRRRTRDPGEETDPALRAPPGDLPPPSRRGRHGPNGSIEAGDAEETP